MRELMLMVVDDEIIVRWAQSSYSATFCKDDNSPGLRATRIPGRSDPSIRMTLSEFLAEAWRLASKKARELGWIT